MYVKGYKSSIFKFINDVVLPEFAQQGDIKVGLINRTLRTARIGYALARSCTTRGTASRSDGTRCCHG